MKTYKRPFDQVTSLYSDTQSEVPEPEASASPGKILEMKIIGPYPTYTESETRGVVLTSVFNILSW